MQQIASITQISTALESLQEHRRFIRAKAEADLRKIDKSIASLRHAQTSLNSPTPEPSHRPTYFRRGFVDRIIPVMRRHGGVMRVGTMLEELRKIPGYRGVSRESFEATLHSELRKKSPRLARTSPGTYILLGQPIPLKESPQDKMSESKAA